jgi:uncharacterized protein (DUF1330 family)
MLDLVDEPLDQVSLLVANAVTALVPFGGHLLIDADNPTGLDGVAPQHLLLIAFDSLEKAQAWKDSKSFKAFDGDRRRAGHLASMSLRAHRIPCPRPDCMADVS